VLIYIWDIVKEPGGCSFPYFHATIFKVLGKLEFLKFWEGADPHKIVVMLLIKKRVKYEH